MMSQAAYSANRRRPAQSIPEKPDPAPETKASRRRISLGKSRDQDLHGVLGIALRAFADLRLTGDTRGHHGPLVLVQLVEEPLPDGPGQFAVLLLVAKGAHHPAAERVDIDDVRLRDQPQGLPRYAADAQGLLVAMAVHHESLGERPQVQIQLVFLH